MASSFSCTVYPESCPVPQVCLYIMNNASNVIGSYCGCQGTYGFVGMPECTTTTPSTEGLTAFFALVFIVFLPIFSRNCYILINRVMMAEAKTAQLKKMFLNEVGAVTLISQCTLLCILMGCIFTFVGIANPQEAQSRPDGARVAYQFRTRNYFLDLAEVFDLSASILISGTCKIEDWID